MELFLDGPAGRLEALLETESDPVRAAAVCCHPHPTYGGTMHNTVVFRAARALRRAGAATLRFNFRGVEGSEGEHDGRIGPGGEEDDALAALDALAERYDAPLWGVGFSFGSRTIASLSLREPRLERLVLIAPPVDVFDCSALVKLRVPALAIWGDRDEFGTLASFERRYPDPPASLETAEIEGADHLFRGRTPKLEEAVLDYARRALETA